MSKYHIIRYVLDVAYGYATPPSSDAESYWRTWLQQIARMFARGAVPPALLEGLKRKGVTELTRVCEEWKPPALPLHKKGIPWQERVAAWIARRDAGNARVAAERKKQRETDLQVKRNIEREIANAEADKRCPEFDAKLVAYLAERIDEQIARIKMLEDIVH